MIRAGNVAKLMALTVEQTSGRIKSGIERRGAARPSFLLAEAAQSECAPSMRAVKNSLAAPLEEGGYEERQLDEVCEKSP
jgi:hypothetical protein